MFLLEVKRSFSLISAEPSALSAITAKTIKGLKSELCGIDFLYNPFFESKRVISPSSVKGQEILFSGERNSLPFF